MLNPSDMAINVVGGVYREYCTRPSWSHTYGSAGRAAVAIGNLGTPVVLHSYMDEAAHAELAGEKAWLPSLEILPTFISQSVGFEYLHDLSVPRILDKPEVQHEAIPIRCEKLIRFGMLEGDAVVDADWAVYDPQNMGATTPFGANGSKARRLGLVLNLWEAQQMAQAPGQSPEDCARKIEMSECAEVVVIKLGPRGALVWFEGRGVVVPAFQTDNVWKIGSGDCFVAHFANSWMHEGLAPDEAARRASLATAYYCQHQAFPRQDLLTEFHPEEIRVSAEFAAGAKREIYLAGPFFDLSQVWMIEEARKNLREMGLTVFSPFHDIGLGGAGDVVQKDLEAIQRADLLFAVTDGLDSGTVYEIGYARALKKPVVVYSERESEEALKMMEGSDCVIRSNYTTAIYTALWEAAKL